MLSYIGGKSKISSFIREFIPNDIETYCECFSGMMWNFFKMDLTQYPNLKTVVYNDVNPLNVNLFRCIKDPARLLEAMNKYESQDKDLFKKFQKELFKRKTAFKRRSFIAAAKYVYLLTQVWSGSNPETSSFVNAGSSGCKYDVFKKKLVDPKWIELFNKITVVENLDFQEVITKYDGEKTYFYCDPPYYNCEKYYSNHSFGLNCHKRLSDVLKSIEGNFSLSYYEFDDLKKWFPKDQFVWEQKDFAKSSGSKTGKKNGVGTELLIMNYSLGDLNKEEMKVFEIGYSGRLAA